MAENNKKQIPEPKKSRLTPLSFIPDTEALAQANGKGFDFVKAKIITGLAEPILDKRVVLVEDAWEEMKKHKEWLDQIRPKVKARYDGDLKQTTEAEFDEDQVKDIKSHEEKYNNIAEAYNLVTTEFNSKAFKSLETILGKNKFK